jgi:hypothetical protein
MLLFVCAPSTLDRPRLEGDVFALGREQKAQGGQKHADGRRAADQGNASRERSGGAITISVTPSKAGKPCMLNNE